MAIYPMLSFKRLLLVSTMVVEGSLSLESNGNLIFMVSIPRQTVILRTVSDRLLKISTAVNNLRLRDVDADTYFSFLFIHSTTDSPSTVITRSLSINPASVRSLLGLLMKTESFISTGTIPALYFFRYTKECPTFKDAKNSCKSSPYSFDVETSLIRWA